MFETIRRMLRSIRQKVPWLRSRERLRHSGVGDPWRWRMKRDFQIRFLKSAGLDPSDYLVDLGCGSLRGGIPLIRHLDRGHYYGIEIDRNRLLEGQRELQESGLDEEDVKLVLTDDLSSLALGRRFDHIWAFSVLIHTTDDILDGALKFVARHLEDGGAFHANVNLGHGREESWYEFPVVWHDLEFFEEMGARHGLRVHDLGSLKSLGHHSGLEDQDSQRMLRITRQ